MWLLNSTERSTTESWLKYWKLKGPLANPPNGNIIPNKLAYVKHFALDVAYITPTGNTETHTMFKRHLYKTLQVMAEAERENSEMRITQKYTTVPWTRVWNSLHTAWVSDRIKSLWYTVFHELLPTNERLTALHLTETDRRSQCGKVDTLQHRLTDCGQGVLIWNWTRARIAALHRMDPASYRMSGYSAPPSNFGPPRDRQP